MSLKSVLKPESSVTVGLAEAAAVYVIYTAALPNHADIRSAPPHKTDIEGARKHAAWKAASVLALVFLITQDVNSALIGGAALAGIDLLAKHANGVHPATGKLADAGPAQLPVQQDNGAAGNETAYPMPDYADSAPEAAGY
jgi:hypothetical protein